jgi:hypothetical protein
MAEVLDVEGPGPPRGGGGRRGSAVTHWGVGDGMGQIYPNNTTFGARQGPHGPRGGLGVAFWPAGRFGARDLVGPARVAGFSAGRAGVGRGGRANKPSPVVLRLNAGTRPAVLSAQRVRARRSLELPEIAPP